MKSLRCGRAANTTSRRLFLQGAGGALLAAPFLTSLGGKEARAQELLPRRNVIFYTHNGCLTNRWFPKVEHGALDASALAGTTLEVLTPHVGKLLFPRGLRSLNAYGAPQAFDPKIQATCSKLTCAPLERKSMLATSHSLDHEIARQINTWKPEPLVLTAGTPSERQNEVLSFSGPEQVFAAQTRPLDVYNLLTGVGSPIEEVANAYLLTQRKSMLDVVRDDLSTYKASNMSQSDRHRIEAWEEVLRSTEVALAPSAECQQVASRITDEALTAANSDEDAQALTLGADMMFDLIALALACDLNRSVVFSFPAYLTFDWDDIHHDMDTAGLANRNGKLEPGGDCWPDVLEKIAQIDEWYAGKFERLVTTLDGIPEGDGKLLDQTATMWLPQFADGKVYNVNNLPIVIAGSAGGYLQQGVAVNVDGGAENILGTGNSEAACGPDGDGTTTPDTGSTTGNVPINKLYVTLLNALGCHAADGGEVTQFGIFDGFEIEAGITDPGDLAELRA